MFPTKDDPKERAPDSPSKIRRPMIVQCSIKQLHHGKAAFAAQSVDE